MKKELEAAATTATEDEIQQVDFTKKSHEAQCEFILSFVLEHGSIDTLQAREHFIMSPATRIWELKHWHNKNFVTQKVRASDGSNKLIARYVLLPGVHHDEVQP